MTASQQNRHRTRVKRGLAVLGALAAMACGDPHAKTVPYATLNDVVNRAALASAETTLAVAGPQPIISRTITRTYRGGSTSTQQENCVYNGVLDGALFADIGHAWLTYRNPRSGVALRAELGLGDTYAPCVAVARDAQARLRAGDMHGMTLNAVSVDFASEKR